LACTQNNLGEVLWKSGHYRDAELHVQDAVRLTAAVGHVTLHLEASRNLLHVLLRRRGPADQECQRQLKYVRECLEADESMFEAMQCWNTIATVHLYNHDVEKTEEALQHAERWTRDNREYHIYTLANRAILRALHDDRDEAMEVAREAVELARSGGNHLAIQQMRTDICNVKRGQHSRALDDVAHYVDVILQGE
jgi:tetratricopeptide (TPR) repeat protein